MRELLKVNEIKSKQTYTIINYCVFLLFVFSPHTGFGQNNEYVPARHTVTLKEAHIGSFHIDSLLLDSYEDVPKNVKAFYFDARNVFTGYDQAGFSDTRIIKFARKHRIPLLGGPMLGNLKENGVTIWFRPVKSTRLRVKVKGADHREKKTYFIDSLVPGEAKSVVIDGLSEDAHYNYAIFRRFRKIAEGSFRTATVPGEDGFFKLAFGSCFHKIGLHNPNLINQILIHEPHTMILTGDIAVDDRYNNINMHRADYLLRDVSMAWNDLTANVPLYTAWDDHDYLDNDLSGIPDSLTVKDQQALREIWYENWNNPEYKGEGIYFNERIGPVELIMLDTRSCREVERRGEYGAYLGLKQQKWLTEVLKQSTAPYKIITSGTMWSDYISNGKDSWGTWDTIARKEIFSLIEKEHISGVILISGDRHGARAYKIPVSEELSLYELQVASLGGVPGPRAIARDSTDQIFGYTGNEITAFGMITVNSKKEDNRVVFRLIDESGGVMEEFTLF